MWNVWTWLGSALFIAGLATAAADVSRAEGLLFLSTQLRPIEEAQKMRRVILKDFPREVDYVTEQPPQLPVRIRAEQQGGTHTIGVIGALHGELQPLAPLDALVPLDDLAVMMRGRGIPEPLMKLGRFGTVHQLYIPWTQASYIMVANKEALPYLPDGADINALSYDQLAAWARAVREKTGKRLLGFPAGPLFRGLPLPVLHRRRSCAVPLGGGRNDVGALRVIMEERQSEFDRLQLHAGAAALGRRLDRLRPHCPRA
jgi:multiple sugar transport system substrate-binding protein